MYKELKENVENPTKYNGDPSASDEYTIDNGFIIIEKGRKIKKWVDTKGNWHEKEV